MTIKIDGHVEQLARAGNGVSLSLTLASSRCTEKLIVEASRGETDAYRPGMPVEITIIPRQELEGNGVRFTPEAKLEVLSKAVAGILDRGFGLERKDEQALRQAMQFVSDLKDYGPKR